MRWRLIPGGKDMTVTVVKSTVIENIFKNFYDLLAAVSGFSTLIYPESPNVNFTQEESYPVIILNSPNINSDSFTLGKGVIEGTIEVNIYTANDPALCDQFASDVIDKIETSKFTLAGVGLKMVQLQSTAKDVILQDQKLKVHMKSVIFEYMFYYDKTGAF